MLGKSQKCPITGFGLVGHTKFPKTKLNLNSLQYSFLPSLLPAPQRDGPAAGARSRLCALPLLMDTHTGSGQSAAPRLAQPRAGPSPLPGGPFTPERSPAEPGRGGPGREEKISPADASGR